MPCRTVLHRTAPCSSVPYRTVLYYTILYSTLLHCTVLHFTVLYCTALYRTVLYRTLLYCSGTLVYRTVPASTGSCRLLACSLFTVYRALFTVCCFHRENKEQDNTALLRGFWIQESGSRILCRTRSKIQGVRRLISTGTTHPIRGPIDSTSQPSLSLPIPMPISVPISMPITISIPILQGALQ